MPLTDEKLNKLIEDTTMKMITVFCKKLNRAEKHLTKEQSLSLGLSILGTVLTRIIQKSILTEKSPDCEQSDEQFLDIFFSIVKHRILESLQ